MGEKFYKYAGIIRDESGLMALKSRLDSIDISEYGISDRGRKYNTNLIDFLQFLNLFEVGRAVVESAIARKESRGSHFRADFPESSSSFQGEFHIFKSEGELKYRFIEKES